MARERGILLQTVKTTKPSNVNPQGVTPQLPVGGGGASGSASASGSSQPLSGGGGAATRAVLSTPSQPNKSSGGSGPKSGGGGTEIVSTGPQAPAASAPKHHYRTPSRPVGGLRSYRYSGAVPRQNLDASSGGGLKQEPPAGAGRDGED